MAESESSPGAAGLGSTLERARARLGLSRLQAAERLRLEPRVIEALETERFELIGPAVYVRGHLRRYGELLGEDVATLERLYTQRGAPAAGPDVSRIVAEPMPQAPQAPTLGLWSAGAVAGLLVLIGLVWWAMRADPQPSTTPSVETVPLEPATLPSPAVAAPAPTVPATAVPRAAVPPAATSANVASGGATQPTAGATPPAPRTARVRMTVSFLGDSWTEVYDANGRRLYADTGRAGTVQSLQGQAPLRVVLGNASGVVMDLNGRRVRLPAGLPDNTNVELSLDAAGQVARRGGDSNPGVP